MVGRAKWLSVLVVVGMVFAVLGYRDFLSERCLISNLEPFPDTFYYSIPAWNLARGEGFKMMAWGNEIKQLVPPVYGVYLFLFFKIFADIRYFYVANMVLAVLSLSIFLKICRVVGFSVFLSLFSSLWLVGNFYFFNLPSLLMAENISLPLVLGLFYLLVVPANRRRVVGAFFLILLLSLTKASNFFVAFAYLFLILHKSVVAGLGRFAFKCLVFFLVLFVGFYLGTHFFVDQKNDIFGESGFLLAKFLGNFRFYVVSLLGGEARFVWFNQHLWSVAAGSFFLLMVLVALLVRRGWVFRGLTLIFVAIAAMSFFYYPDLRYIYAIVPIWVLLAVAGLQVIYNKGKKLVLVLVVVATFGIVDLKLLKRQIGLNFRHSEVPWNYLAVGSFNDFFGEVEPGSYLASFLPPFYFYVFGSGQYNYLPLSNAQEFFVGKSSLVLKRYLEMTDEFTNLLKNGRRVYVSNYYVANNLEVFGRSWAKLAEVFDVDKLVTGCFDTCNIYRLSLKK